MVARRRGSGEEAWCAGSLQRPQKRVVMNLEETIAVAIGIAVGVIFIVYFLLVAAGLSLL
jgi:hypothetical protein